jgi:hypothetical protein
MRRALIRIVCGLVPLLVILAVAEDAHAYSWMIRHGYSGCTTCHTDPSGGELLTPYGRAQGDLLLRMRYGKDSVSAAASDTSTQGDSFDSFDSFDEGGGKTTDKKSTEVAPPPEESGPSPTAGFLFGAFDLPEFLLLGGAYRHAFLYEGDFRQFPMQADLWGQMVFGRFHVGGTIGVAKVKAGSPHSRAAQITTNQGDELNVLSRTHWIGMDLGASRDVMVRAGRLNLPFGIRIPEHTMWIREATRTDRESDQQHGVSVAFNGSEMRGEVMGIAGNYQVNPDRYRERGYSAYIETTSFEPVAVGASSLLTFAKADAITLEQDSTARGAHGLFMRAKVSRPLVVFVEANALHTSRRDLGYVGFLQADLEIVQGLHFGATGEILDQGYIRNTNADGTDVKREPGLGNPRFGAWGTIDWFFLPHLEVRADAILRQDSAFTLLGQLHMFL